MTTTSSREASAGDGADSRRRLLEAAARLFRAKGYQGTTTRELASVLGMQGASIYYHIDKKEDLLYRLCLEGLERLLRAADAAVAAEADPARRIRAFVHAHVETALRDQDVQATMLIEFRALTAARQADVLGRRRAYATLVRDLIRDAQTAGAVRGDIAAGHIARGLLNLLNWSIFWFRPTGSLSATELADILAALFLEGALCRD